MRLQTIACLVLGVAALLAVAPEASFAQPECVTVVFITDPEVPGCGSCLEIGDAIKVTSSPTTVSVNGCSTTLTRQYDGVLFLCDDGCNDGTSNDTCTIFTDGPLSGSTSSPS